jgi:hypothetical protein
MATVTKTTRAVEIMLNKSLGGYTIERNTERNDRENFVGDNGFINIYPKEEEQIPLRISAGVGAWATAEVAFEIEVQVVSHNSETDAEDKLEKAFDDIVSILKGDITLGKTVNYINSFKIEWLGKKDDTRYWFMGIITVTAQVDR